MKLETNSVDYGVYIDREKAIVIALDHIVHKALIGDMIIENGHQDIESDKVRNEEHVQNRKNEALRKFCRSVIEKVVNANSIVVFGPSTSKFELQKEIRNSKRLKNVKEEIVTTDFMDNKAALHFAKNLYTPVLAEQQIFTGRKQK